jgi:alcohol dehydrogenase (NADP+)
MIETVGYAAHSSKDALAPFAFQRREPGPRDVQMDILYCGVCHSDLHQVRDEWAGTTYPIVPGHEIIGRVTKVGTSVTGFKAGDLAGVGCMVNSCRTCPECREHLEQYCGNGAVWTYNSPDPFTGAMTYGGYSKLVVVDQDFVLRIPEKLNLSATAPLLCAGITTYSPLRHWQVGRGDRVGVFGLGGLGHMAVKFAHAFGAETVLFTTSPGKIADAKRMGADDVVISKDPEELKKHANRFDFILDTVGAPHDLDALLALLKRDKTLCLVGVPEQRHPSPHPFSFISKRRRLAGSCIGGIAETQEMLDFCAAHNITSDVELIPIQKINEAYDRMLRSDVKYRFVIDLASLTQN